MDLSVRPFACINTINFKQTNRNKVNHSKTFSYTPKSNKHGMMKTSRLALLGLLLLTAISCKDGNTKNSIAVDNKETLDKNITKTSSGIEKTDSGDVMVTELIFDDDTYSKTYFDTNQQLIQYEYSDKNKNINIKRQLKDGSEVLETIKPDGERIVVNKNKDKTISTTTYPNGEKLIVETSPSNYTKTKFFNNGKINEIISQKTILSDDTTNTESFFEVYNRRGFLLYWDNNTDYSNDSTSIVCDSLGRVIHNPSTNTKYEYNDADSLPIREITEKNGCEHIKIFENGEIKSDYFKSKNGIITPADSIKKPNWSKISKDEDNISIVK